MLVTFTDIADPATVREVSPDNLAASFGPGVSLRRITLGITKDRVTEGRVDKLLEWLAWSRERFLAAGGGETPLKMPNTVIGRTSFVRRES